MTVGEVGDMVGSNALPCVLLPNRQAAVSLQRSVPQDPVLGPSGQVLPFRLLLNL